MTVQEVKWLQESFNLVYNYRRDEAIREQVNSTFYNPYTNKPVFLYINHLISFSPNYFKYYRQIFQRDINFFANKKVRQVWKDVLPNRIWQFFTQCEADTTEFNRVLTAIKNPATADSFYSEDQIRRLSEIENPPPNQFGSGLLNKAIGSLVGAITNRLGNKESPYDYFLKQLEKQPPYQTPKEQLETLKQRQQTNPSPPIPKPELTGDESPYDYFVTQLEEKFPEPYQPEEQEKHGGPNLPQPNLQDIKDTRDLIKTGSKLARGLEFGGTGTGAAGAGGAAAGGTAGAGAVTGGSAVAGVSLGAGWVIVLAILIVILIFILGAILSNLLESSLPTNNQINQTITENKVSISKSGPDKIDNGREIQYDLNITYRGTIPANIEVTDKLPDQTSFISASDGGINEGGTIKWTLQNMLPNGSRNITLIIKPEDDIWVSNTAEAKVVSVPNPGTGGTSAGGSSTGLPPDFPNPNQDNCGGKYDLKNPLGNFGDPACAYTKDDLYKLLKREDPVNADYWFNTVVKCESGYNPNAYGDHSAIGTPDAAGAWGLYQMGRGKNGKYDHGDVEWEEQTINAIQYNQVLIANRLGWRYWQCAKDRW